MVGLLIFDNNADDVQGVSQIINIGLHALLYKPNQLNVDMMFRMITNLLYYDTC